MKTINATDYQFSRMSGDGDYENPFSYLGVDTTGAEEVAVAGLEDTEFFPNGVRFSYYGSGTVTESAGLLLSDGRVAFCIVSGYRFTDTFHSAEDITMEYYMMTPLESEA